MEFGGVWCSLVASGGVWWSLVEFGGVWWSLVEFGEVWWSLVGRFRGNVNLTLFLKLFSCEPKCLKPKNICP